MNKSLGLFLISVVCIGGLGAPPVLRGEEEDITLDPVTVTGSRIPGPTTLGSLTVITGEEIRESSAETLLEFLDLLGGIDVTRRGAGEIQGDLSIRGSSFEQVLVLVDGVPLNDPQTAHHDLDFPFLLDEVEQVEILKGPGSSLYGTDALGGTVHVKTITSPGHYSIRGKLHGGIFSENDEYASWGGHLRLSAPFLKGGATLSAGGESSNGYREGTDFRVLKASTRTRQSFSGTPVEIIGGYMDKEFGARDFYAPYPSWEHTDTLFLKTGAHFLPRGSFRLKPVASFRRHTDHFVLDRDNPEFFQSHHETNSAIGILEFLFSLANAGSLAVVMEENGDWMESDQLGDHTQSRTAFGLEYQTPETFPLTVNPSLRTDFHSRLGLILSPSLGVGCNPSRNILLRFSTGLSHRAPSFTELYYASPANQGDPDLESERSFSLNGGASFELNERIALSLALFRRADWDLIDWVRENPEDPWQARNLDDIVTLGTELAATARLPRRLKLKGEYGYLHRQRKVTGLEYKYSQNYPVHRFTTTFWGQPVWKIRHHLVVDYQRRNESDNILLVDLTLSLPAGKFSISLVGKNLADSEYEEIPGLIQPGRYLGMRIGFEWDNK